MKKCKKCGVIKPLNLFYKNNNRMKDGHLNTCKMCCLKIHGAIYDKRLKEKYGIGRRTITLYGLKLALEVYDRAKRKCENCGSEYDLTIHHIDHRGRNFINKGLTPNNTSNNLQVLCRSCHGRIHGSQHGKKVR